MLEDLPDLGLCEVMPFTIKLSQVSSIGVFIIMYLPYFRNVFEAMADPLVAWETILENLDLDRDVLLRQQIIRK